jgi:protein-S-isoprenylcysteine O-methyltransferase Ste14
MKSSLFVKQLLGTLLFFSLIFLSAGRLLYWQGLIYVATGLIMMVLSYTILRLDPELAKERGKPGEGAKKWDKSILGLSFLTTLAMYVVAGLDSGRFHWSPDGSALVIALGVLMTGAGQLLFLISQKQNKFFSSTVRIQTERGHTVCDTGLYKVVRHPAYMGSFIQAVGFPLIFTSYWSILPVSVMLVLLVVRTRLEDNTLMTELNGYTEYAFKTRYKLIPGIW